MIQQEVVSVAVKTEPSLHRWEGQQGYSKTELFEEGMQLADKEPEDPAATQPRLPSRSIFLYDEYQSERAVEKKNDSRSLCNVEKEGPTNQHHKIGQTQLAIDANNEIK